MVNNVKTWASVPPILTRGADWYAAMGTERSPGTTVFSLEGAVKNRGLIEVPFGTTLQEIIYEIGEAEDGRPFISMAHCEGQTLKERIDQGPLPMDEARAVTVQIAEAISQVIEPAGVAVTIEAEHLCMKMRGVEKQNSTMKTSVMLGSFRESQATRMEYLQLIAD